MQILVLIGLYFLKCTKFVQLILRKIIKIVATRCQILTLKYAPKSISAGAPLQTQLGELTINAYNALPDPLAGFNGPTSKGRGGEGREGDGRGGEEREWREGREGAFDLSASSF